MPINVTQRQVIVFTAGIALGVAAAWAVFGRHSGAPASDAPKPAPVAAAKAATKQPVAVAVDACTFKPVVATAASDDGRVQLQAELSGRSAKDVDAWILDGKEAVAAGRQKDAETDFLMACRAAEKLGDSGAMPQAEAMYHLGRHYAGLAGAAAPGRSGELWSRAESLFAASLQAFGARYGETSDRTRFAAKGLAEAREHTGGTAAVAAAPVPPKAVEAKVAKAAPTAPAKVQPPKELAAAPAPAPKEQVAKTAAPKPQEPALAVTPAAPTKAPEPAVAVAKPPPPKPRPAPAPVQDAEPAVVVEPPARAVGSATGSQDEPAAPAQ